MNLRTYNGPKINEIFAIVSCGNFHPNTHKNANVKEHYNSSWIMYYSHQFGSYGDNWPKFKCKKIKEFILEKEEFFIVFVIEKNIYTTVLSDNFKKGIIK